MSPFRSPIPAEDFRSRLEGDPLAARKSELGDSKQDFYYFWRNVGRTGKTTGERGSWGLGKAIYASSSLIRSVFGWTIRSSDGKSLLMGQAALGIHDLPDRDEKTQQHDAYGFYGEFCARPEDAEFAVPIEDDAAIKRFREHFKLRREEEPGLSIVVPFPLDDLRSERVGEKFAISVIQQYAYPILAGQLEVEVVTPVQSFSLVDRDSLFDALGRVDWEANGYDKHRAEQLLQLAWWSVEEADGQRVELERADNPKATWETIQFPGDSLPECRNRFTGRKSVAIRVPILIRSRQDGNVLSHFDVYLDQDESLKGNIFDFIRQGLSISDVPGPCITGVAGLVVVEDGALAQLLRDAENPSHTKWATKAERLTKNYIGGGEGVKFVKDAPKVLLKWLLETSDKPDTDLLAEFFPDPEPEANVPKTGSGKKLGRKSSPPDPPPPPPKPVALRVNQLDDGFSMARVPDVELPSKEFVVQVAFDCIAGNPFNAWEKYDFVVDKKPIDVAVTGGSLQECQDNRIRVRILSDQFKLHVRGFPADRDLVVKHWWIRDHRESP